MKLSFGKAFYTVPNPPDSWLDAGDEYFCAECQQQLIFKFNTLPYTEPEQVRCACFTLDLQPYER